MNTPQTAAGTLLSPSPCSPFFVFDVESVGLHGEAFAVAGGVYINAAAQSEFRFCCPLEEAKGDDDDREWVKSNVPVMEITHRNPAAVREAFWSEWEEAKKRYPGITMAGECIWPVEAGFVAACIRQEIADRKWSGPYPFHEIASVMLAAGMDPMATYEREESEKPAHEPLADARQSARLLATALRSLAMTERSNIMSTKEQLAEQLAVELSVFATWRDDYTGTLARSAAELRRLEAANAELLESLSFYAEQARLCRLIHSEGDPGRNSLAKDGGNKARAAIAKHGGAA